MKKSKRYFLSLCFILMGSGLVFAQESQPTFAQEVQQTPAIGTQSNSTQESKNISNAKPSKKEAKAAAKREASKKQKQEKAPNSRAQGPKTPGFFPDRTNFKHDFSRQPPFGNPEAIFRSHPEYKQLVESETDFEKQSRELVRRYNTETNTNKKKDIENELRTVVGQHFEVRQKRRLYELNLFKERIEQMRAQIESRTEKKDRIIDQRIQDLIGSKEDLSF